MFSRCCGALVRTRANISNTGIAFFFLAASARAASANDRASIDAAVPLQRLVLHLPSGRLRLQGNASPRHRPYTPAVWANLGGANKCVNDIVKPSGEAEHWGTIEKWFYPSDGYGNCEHYVLQKAEDSD
ncbi:transglutaminase-like cysteine peptidase [Bradyrhizobium sp. USDA 4529]